ERGWHRQGCGGSPHKRRASRENRTKLVNTGVRTTAQTSQYTAVCGTQRFAVSTPSTLLRATDTARSRGPTGTSSSARCSNPSGKGENQFRGAIRGGEVAYLAITRS